MIPSDVEAEANKLVVFLKACAMRHARGMREVPKMKPLSGTKANGGGPRQNTSMCCSFGCLFKFSRSKFRGSFGNAVGNTSARQAESAVDKAWSLKHICPIEHHTLKYACWRVQFIFC